MFEKCFATNRSCTGQQLVEHDAQGIDVAARVDVDDGHFGLFRAHAPQSANHLPELREQGCVRESRIERLGDTEVDDFGDGFSFSHANKYVGWFQVAVDDAFAMSMMHRGADLKKKVQPFV